jgi:hypothetical protein
VSTAILVLELVEVLTTALVAARGDVVKRDLKRVGVDLPSAPCKLSCVQIRRKFRRKRTHSRVDEACGARAHQYKAGW